MHKVPWPCPVVVYALEGDELVARAAHEVVLVREVAPSVCVRQLRDLGAAHEALRSKLMGCPFLVLELPCGGHEAHAASGAAGAWDPEERPLLDAELQVEHEYVYVNLGTHVTTYAGSGELLHAERVHCATVCLPRRFPASQAARVASGLREYHARNVDRQCRSARVLVGHGELFYYLDGSDFSILKQLGGP